MDFPNDSAVKNPPAMQEAWVQSLGQEDLVEEEMANHSSILPLKVPWTEEPGMLQSKESDATEECTMIIYYVNLLIYYDNYVL